MRTTSVALIAFSLTAVLLAAGTAAAQSEDPTPEAPRWLETTYDLELGGDLTELVLDGVVEIHEIETDDPRLQDFCNGPCSADQLREAYQSVGPDRQQQLEQAIESGVEEEVRNSLSSLAGPDSDPSASADVSQAALRDEPEGYEYKPAIPVNTTGSAQLELLSGTEYTTEQIDALFRMGARVEKTVDQEVRPGVNRTITLGLDEPLGFVDADQGTVSPDGTTITWTRANWRSPTPATIEDEVLIGNPDVRVPDAEDAGVNVTLDISDVSANYGGLLGGANPADAQVAISIDGHFKAIENPRQLDQVQLDYLSADAIRIALDNGLLDPERLTTFEDQARDQIKSSFQQTFGVEVDVTGGIPAQALSTDRVGDPVGTGGPILLSMSAQERVPFPPPTQGQGSGPSASGFTVTTLSLGDFELPNVDTPGGLPARITLVLPDGVELSYESIQGATIEETTIEGRSAYTFTPEEGQTATIQGAEVVVNHPLVWDLFWPLLVFLALLLIVLPAVVILLAIRQRRGEDEQIGHEESSPVAGGQASQREEGEG